MLSCDCDYGDYDSWYLETPRDFIEFDCLCRKRCISCKRLINMGEDCLEFEMYRNCNSDIEERIHGDEVQIASQYMCEDCGAIFLNLSSLGYCLEIGHHVKEDLEDYWRITGFTPKKELKWKEE